MLKKIQRKKHKNNIDKALIFSAIMIVIFTIVMIYTFWKFQSVPDALIVGFFACFSFEGGYLTYIHKLKKEREKEMLIRAGDITGFDDAEILDVSNETDDVPDESDLVIDTEGED